MKGVLLLLALLSPAAAQPASFSFCDGMTRISRDGTPPSAQTHTLHAARGEWEPLQIIVTATPAQLKGIEIIATGIAKHDSDVLLPAPRCCVSITSVFLNQRPWHRCQPVITPTRWCRWTCLRRSSKARVS
jgi:hypothetical protein